MSCYCGSGIPFDACCQPIIEGAPAETAEQLMRSRYSAYCTQNGDYILYSWHPKTRPKEMNKTEWVDYQNLEIVSRQQGEKQDKVGKVAFVAQFQQNEQIKQLSECSRFKRFEGRWVYYDGKIE